MSFLKRWPIRSFPGHHIIKQYVTRFAKADGGNFAIITAFLLVPLTLAVGGAVEYSAAMAKRSDLQVAADTAVLVAASRVDASLSERETAANQLFQHNLKRNGTVAAGKLIERDGTYTYSASVAVETTFLKVAGIRSLEVAVAAQAVPSSPDFDIVFVLDTSTSMIGSRLHELKAAVDLFIKQFDDSENHVQIAVVPFNSWVRVSSLHMTNEQTYLDEVFCDKLEPSGWFYFYKPLCDDQRAGFIPGTSGAYVTSAGFGYRGSRDAFLYKATRSDMTVRIHADRAVCYDKGYMSERDVCHDYESETNNFLVYDQPARRSCVIDRNQPFDTTDDPPDQKDRKYPTRDCGRSKISETLPLDSNLATVSNYVKQLQAEGFTNLTIGVQWGMEALSATPPLGGRRAGSKPIMIILSDGGNTVNRWDDPTYAIDKRTIAACQHAKAIEPKIDMYSINLIGGVEAILRQCASEEDNYFAVMQAKELKDTFSEIATRIKGVRLTQ